MASERPSRRLRWQRWKVKKPPPAALAAAAATAAPSDTTLPPTPSPSDLGFYLANYSSADCMSWGYMQGCGYVRSRCGLGIHDQSAVLSSASASKCRGEGFWRSYPDPYLAQKCAEGNDPCSTQAASGYDAAAALPDGSTAPVCDAQCASDGGVREGCSTAPTVRATGHGQSHGPRAEPRATGQRHTSSCTAPPRPIRAHPHALTPTSPSPNDLTSPTPRTTPTDTTTPTDPCSPAPLLPLLPSSPPILAG